MAPSAVELKPRTFFAMIPMTAEVFSDAYSRPLRRSYVNGLRRGWTADAVGTVYLSQREDGPTIRYAMLDGQHRYAAARAEGMTEVPARIFHGLTYEQEATYYVLFGTRKNQSAYDRFHARLEAQEPVAEDIRDILAGFGLRIDRYKAYGVVAAVYALDQVHMAKPRQVFVATIKLLVDAFAGDPGAYNQYSIHGIAEFWVRYGYMVEYKKLIAKLQKYGIQFLSREATSMQSRITQSKASWGQAVRYIYNIGRRSGRLPDWKDAVPDVRFKEGRGSGTSGSSAPQAAKGGG